MGFLRWFTDNFTVQWNDDYPDQRDSGIASDGHDVVVNPATGLPMINGIGSVDVAGNPFGTDMNQSDTHSALSDDTFGSAFDTTCGSGIDDSMGMGVCDSFGGGSGLDDL